MHVPKKWWWVVGIAVPLTVALIGIIPTLIVNRDSGTMYVDVAGDVFQGTVVVYNVTVVGEQAREKSGEGLPESVLKTLRQATDFIESGEFERAIPLLESAQEAAPVPAVYNNIGAAYLATGNHERAKQYFDQALAGSPDEETVRFNLSQVTPDVRQQPLPPDTHIVFSAIDRILQTLPTGNIAFNVPSTMFLEETYGIRLLLSPAKSVQELQEELQKELQERMGTEETLEGAEIRIAPRMQARLTGQGFEITAVKSETQLVSGEQETEWQWDVTPKRANTLRLHLTLSAILVVDGEPAPRTIRTFDKIIEVQVTWGQRITGFVGNNWQWLWAAILVPIAGWLWRKRKKKTSA